MAFLSKMAKSCLSASKTCLIEVPSTCVFSLKSGRFISFFPKKINHEQVLNNLFNLILAKFQINKAPNKKPSLFGNGFLV